MERESGGKPRWNDQTQLMIMMNNEEPNKTEIENVENKCTGT